MAVRRACLEAVRRLAVGGRGEEGGVIERLLRGANVADAAGPLEEEVATTLTTLATQVRGLSTVGEREGGRGRKAPWWHRHH